VGADPNQNSTAQAQEFVQAFKNAVKASLNTEPSRIRCGRLIRALFTSHYSYVQSKQTLIIQVNANFLSVNNEIVHSDRADNELPSFAATLRRSGLRSIQFAPVAIDIDDFRSFVELIAESIKEAPPLNLVNRLWALDFKGISFRSADTLDVNSWSLEEELVDLDRSSFSENFLFRVRQTFSPHMIAARIRQSKKSLEGNVSGDSLSMESHFNIVFGKQGSSENIDKEELESNKTFEPVLVERLTASLRSGAQDFEDEEFRDMLSKQLSGNPALVSNQELLRRSVAVARTLEINEPPTLSPEDAAVFYLHVLRAGVALEDLAFLAELFDLIMSAEATLTIIQAIDMVSIGFANIPDLESLLPVIEASLKNSELQKCKAQLTEILLHLAPFPTLDALGKMYSNIRDQGSRRAFQQYFVFEGEKAIEFLEPIFASRDEDILNEAFSILFQIGPAAQLTIKNFTKHPDSTISRIAQQVLTAPPEPSALSLRDQHINKLESNSRDERFESLTWLATLGPDNKAFEVIEGYIRLADFKSRGALEMDTFLKTLVAVGGPRAASILKETQEEQEGSAKRPGTRRIQDAATKALEALEKSKQGEEKTP
jgi:hypothetical protein